MLFQEGKRAGGERGEASDGHETSRAMLRVGKKKRGGGRGSGELADSDFDAQATVEWGSNPFSRRREFGES